MTSGPIEESSQADNYVWKIVTRFDDNKCNNSDDSGKNTGPHIT